MTRLQIYLVQHAPSVFDLQFVFFQPWKPKYLCEQLDPDETVRNQPPRLDIQCLLLMFFFVFFISD